MHPTTVRLLAWYADFARDLPWRGEVSPYRALLSEAMLQQTRVETALPYFARFAARWPTVEALAAAPAEEVLGAWAGLGYYRRARALHTAAKQIVAQGAFPTTLEGLRALPGVGPYSAAAIGSIALGLDALALDGNLARVGARLGAIEAPVGVREARAAVADLMGGMLPPGRAGDFNQALMDLGATICLPRDPRCRECPLAADCRARAAGLEAQLPRRRPRKPPRAVRAVALVATRGLASLLVRRPAGGLLGGLWGPPTLVLEPGGTVEAGLVRLVEQVGGTTVPPRPCGEVLHVFTHQRWQVAVYALALTAVRRPSAEDQRIAVPGTSEAPPLSRLAEKILAKAEGGGVRH
ncbi:MAG: NUDIX domain-containing protein [Pseudomonadota bacterium]